MTTGTDDSMAICKFQGYSLDPQQALEISKCLEELQRQEGQKH